MQVIERSGTTFAFPSQTVYLQQIDPPEIMAPPPRSETAANVQAELASAGRTKGFGESDGAA